MLPNQDPLTNYTITPGKQFATATITAEGMVVSPKLTTGGERANIYGFAALKSDGTVVTWGSDPAVVYTPAGPISKYVPFYGESGVTQIFSTGHAFAALKSDGTVTSWGDSRYGGLGTGLSGVTQIFSNNFAFAAIKSDGTVFSRGDGTRGGSGPTGESTVPTGLSGVTQIFTNAYAFAALKSDGTVVSWGDSGRGGSAPTGLGGVTHIFSTNSAFAAIKSDGTVDAWGDGGYGGTAPTGLSGVTQIFSNYWAFAALKSDGTVTSWGDTRFGGMAPTGLSDVTQIFSNNYAFAALRSDGTVVAWGDNLYGGTAPTGLSDVTQIFSNGYAFAALKSDGSVVAWGSRGGTAPTGLIGVTKIFSNTFYGAFVALKSDGTVVAWGDGGYGSSPIVPAPSGLSGVTQIFSNDYAFAALKSDGTVVAWGDGGYGGTAPYELNGVVGFANPFTDDRLVAFSPIITLAVSPDSAVAEDSIAKLVYTFTRSGPSTNALIINYDIAGNADSSDYTGTTPGTGKTISFAAGASTVTLTINQTADTTVEADETILVTLATGRGYTVGTTAAVVGTIINDDIVPTITLAVSPASAAEDDIANIVYTFARTGPTTNPLTVNYVIAGNADSSDYTGATPGIGKTITFSTGASTATLAIDPTADSIIESNETVDLTLSTGIGYIVETTGAITGTITNVEVQPSVSVVTIANGNEADGSPTVFRFERTGDISTALSIGYQLFGTAKAGSDYRGDISGIIAFAPGGQAATLSLTTLADALVDPGETVIAKIIPASTPENGYTIQTRMQYAEAAISSNGVSTILKNAGRSGWNIGEFQNVYAIAALKSDGSVAMLDTGLSNLSFDNLPSEANYGFTQIFSNRTTFIGLRSGGSIQAWGGIVGSRLAPTYTYPSLLIPTALDDVINIYSNAHGFAALRRDRSVISWGGDGGGSFVTDPGQIDLSNVIQICATEFAFLALRNDGTVASWACDSSGGGWNIPVPDGLTGVRRIFTNRYSCTALKNDGTVVSWRTGSQTSISPTGLSQVVQVFSSEESFAALREDGTVASWSIYNNATVNQVPAGLTDVVDIFATDISFTALKSDGTVVSWGNNISRGYGGSQVIQVCAGLGGYCGLLDNGTVVSWGAIAAGVEGVAMEIGLSNVSRIYSNGNSFAALKTDGTLSVWGSKTSGGVAPDGLTNISYVLPLSNNGFAAIKNDGTIIVWGPPARSQVKPFPQGQGIINVVGFNNPFTDDRLTPTPVITLVLSPASIAEDGATNLVYTFTRSGPPTNALTINYDIAGTAAASDYTGATPGSGKTITFAAGSSTAILTIDPTADTTVESDETVALTLAAGNGYIIGTTTAVVGTITNLIDSGDAIFSITGTRAVGQILTAAIATVDPDGNGSSSFSYTWQSSTDGSSWANVGTNSASYTIAAADEGKQLRLLTAYADAQNFSETVTTSVGTIPFVDNGDSSFSITGTPGVGNTLTATTTTADPDGNGVFTYAWQTSTNGTTWSPVGTNSSSYTVAAGDEGKQIKLVVTYLDGQGFNESVTTSAGTISSSITLAVSPYSVIEDGTANLVYTFSRTGPNTNALTVNYSIAGTADSSDYTGATPGTGKTITFAANSATATLTIDPTADTTVEFDETVALTLAAGTGYTVGTTTAVTGTITNDDTSVTPGIPGNIPVVYPYITLSVSPASVQENSSSNLLYTFTRTGVTANALSVNYTVGGTATLSTDYTGIAATPATKIVTFAAGASTATLMIEPTADTTVESDETIAITLGIGTGYTVGTTSAVVGTITNDDTPPPTYILIPSATSVNEGSSISYTLTTTNVASGTNFYYQFSGTGINAADFTTSITSGTEVVSSNGQLTITRTLSADKTTEGTETLTLKVFTDSTATTLLATNAAVTVNDTSLTIAKPTQQVYTLSPQIPFKPKSTVSAALLYTTSSGDANLSGLTLNLHYNSSILTPSGANNGVSGELPAAISSTTILADTNNLDNDPLTDKILQLLWATFDNSFPSKTLPASLATVSFDTSAIKIDPVTGQPLSTTVRYTASETAPNHDFLTGFTTFRAQQFNLDVDGDGKVTALGDGLMIIRKLFGAAFAGDALTAKARSNSGTRTTAEIHDFIQQGIDGGLLDVDKDGKTTGLGDGLMVIRRLFGAAFDGSALTNKAINAGSPYFGQATDFDSVGINIDALKPVMPLI